MPVLNTNIFDHTKEPMFFGKPVGIARFDRVRYPWVDKMVDKMNSYHWLPTGRDLSRDGSDFRKLNDSQKHIFLSNLKRQIILDTVQGRAITRAFMPVASVPEIEPLLVTWEYFETIHSKTYTHIIRTALPDASGIFDSILDDESIVNTTKNLTKYYDDYIDYLDAWVYHVGNDFSVSRITETDGTVLTLHELKKKFFKCLFSINVLEGLRFYVSFACSFSFAERNLMEGNAGLIKLICRDENLHTSITQKIINALRKDDPLYDEIFEECQEELIQMFKDTVDEEKEWAEYLFKDGSMIGLNSDILGKYIEYLANRRMKAVGLKPIFEQKKNPLSWMDKWTGSKSVQVANQETQTGSYLVGGVESDLNKKDNALSGFTL